MCKLLEAIYTFSHKVKLTYLTANKSKKTVFLLGEVMKKIWLSIGCSAKWVLCKVQYFRRLMIDFRLYSIWISKNTQT